ncbi:MAG: right-handed parallel beta-helix repeat-containing protein, partial [Armatimonadetes bacterium]|nr:right-handed parallel beta-helix repeat-containing protein [Armatimonadota bacterium]
MRSLLAALVLLLLLGSVAIAAETVLYVSPTGDDTWSGKLPQAKGNDGPFATLPRARDEARQAKAAGSVKIVLRGGRYLLPETLALTADDAGTAEAPITYIAFRGEKPLLAGCRAVTGFKPGKGQIMVADLKGTPLEGVKFRQLFCNGERQVLARTPNFDPKDVHGGEWAHVAAVDGDGVKDRFHYVEGMEKNWTHVERAQVGIHPYFDWAWNVLPVKSVDRDERVITLKGNVSYDLHVGDRYFIQNLLEELDAPGEWYLDPDQNLLYFWPPSDLAKAEVLAPVVGDLIKLDGASFTTLRGLTIEGCDGTGVVIANCESSLLAQSIVRNTGGWGVSIGGGHNSGAKGNDVYATGAGGIMLNGGDRKTLDPGRNFADNNVVHHIAVFAKTYNTGINVGGVGNVASHNLIHDTYHAGMTLSGNENVVEYNVVHHTNLGSADTGGIYYCSRDFTMRGNKIQFNIFHHCGGFGKDNSWAPVRDGKIGFSYPHFTWGIYLDDPTSGTLVYGNILWSVPMCGLHNHGGRDNTWENNIVVDAPAVNAGMLWDGWTEYPPIIEKLKAVQTDGSPYLKLYPELANYDTKHPSGMTGLKFIRNIFTYTAEGSKWLREKSAASWQGGQLLYSYSTDEEAFKQCQFDGNVIQPPPGVDLKISLRRQPQPGKLLSWDEWQATGMDQTSVIGDPMFVDAAQHNYALKPGSPALKLGFKPIPQDKIGPYQDQLRASWPIVEAPGASALGEFTTQRFFKLPGYEPVKAEEFVPRDGAPNFFAKLAAGKSVKVAYFGGGIHYADGWRGKVLKWLREHNPNSEITEIDASICDCSRGSGFSVWRFAQDVLSKQPDLVLVDFASDDQTTNVDSIWAAVEGVVRQARQANPKLDVVFVYAFRAGDEAAFAEGNDPTAISAYEKVAAHYGIPGINMAYRVAQLARAGRLIIKATPEQAKDPQGKIVFSMEGVRPTAAANDVYAQALTEALDQLSKQTSAKDHPLPEEFYRGAMKNARLFAITESMLEGKWEKLPPDNIGGRGFANHFNEVWGTRTPGAKLTFRFRGTESSIFDLMGPDTGLAQVSVDGKVTGTRQQVDPWAYYHRLAAIPLWSGPEGEHTVTVELLPTVPDRSVPIAEAKKVNRYKAEDFD